MPRDVRIPEESYRTVFVRIDKSSVFIGFGCVCICKDAAFPLLYLSVLGDGFTGVKVSR